MEGKPLIKTDFLFVSACEEESAERILVESESISAVPVLDDAHHIIKEYRKEHRERNTVGNDSLFRLYRHLLPSGKDEKNLMIVKFENELQKRNAGKITAETDGKLVIVDETAIGDINKYVMDANYQVIYDCTKKFWVREIIYKKNNIDYCGIKFPFGNMKVSFPSDVLYKIFWQFLGFAGEGRSIIIAGFEAAGQKKQAEKILCKLPGSFDIVDEADIEDVDELIKEGNYQKVYDCVPEHFWLRERTYKKYELIYYVIGHRVWDEEWKQESLCDFLGHFRSIGFFAEETVSFTPMLNAMPQAEALDVSGLQWKNDIDAFEYSGNLGAVPEVVYTSFCLLKNPVIMYKGHFIPVISKLYEYFWDAHTLASDYDLAYNIIPQLQKNGIKIVIFSDIDKEKEQILAYDEEKAYRRRKRPGKEYWDILKEFCNHEWKNGKIDIFMEEHKKIQYHNKNGYLQMGDLNGEYINVFQSERLTVGNPSNYKHMLWIFGGCMIRGLFVDDANTIGSHLRKWIDDSYCIKNMGIPWRSLNMSVRDACFKAGDVLILQVNYKEVYAKAGLEVHSMERAYRQCPNLMEHVLDCLNHVDRYLSERIAAEIYAILTEKHIFDTDSGCENTGRAVSFGIKKKSEELPAQLSAWLESVKRYKGTVQQRTGAIVMNCNPFTLGHRYLIEEACSQVDRLLVFIVEEDKSFFKFADRFKMVRMGTGDLQKVMVIPSGKYIISAETLPGYFEKDGNPDVVLDAALDLNIFSHVIAKELNIKVRFAGEEPTDAYTRQYNLAMSKILPEHGIDFVEIPRKKSGDKIISASYVRKLMEKRNYFPIKDLVMPLIYDYLEAHYFV